MTAVYLASHCLEGPFLELQGLVARPGGDVNTIGAMAGAIWRAARGTSKLPEHSLETLEDRERLEHLAKALYLAAATRSEA